MLSHTAFVSLCRARDLLGEDCDRPLSIRDVARRAGVSPFHFIRQFQALFGETPHQFRIRARLNRAKQLLATSDYSVTDVCMEVGFSSLGSFSDLFARRIGAPPSTCRLIERLAVGSNRSINRQLPDRQSTIWEAHAPARPDR
jgi:AraC-like DNA-binding protein